MDNENSSVKQDGINPKVRKKFWKFWLVMATISVGFLAVVMRLFTIQIIEAGDFQSKAKKQHESKVTVEAERGNIYDTHKKLLSTTVKKISVAVDPTKLTDTDKFMLKQKQQLKKQICEIVSRITGISKDRLLNKINSSTRSFVWLARGLDCDKVAELKDIKDRALILVDEHKRQYIYGAVGAQVIGCTDIDDRGVSGVEKSFDSMLKDIDGFMVMQRDGRGYLRPSPELPYYPAMNGKSVQLTIDIDLQRIVEYELKRGVTTTNAHSGTAIAIVPRTGEILAMASYPNFNPNSTTDISFDAMRSRAITDPYEPGSTFKVITAAAALEENLITPDEILNGFGGVLNCGTYSIRDVHGLGKVSFRQALEQSSNVIFSQVAARVPSYKFYKYIRDFGFGTSLGLDIPGEVPGRLIKPEMLNTMAKRFLGHGYGLSATPLQVLCAFATIANRGILMKPYIVKAVYDDGNTVYQCKSEIIRTVIGKKTADTVTDMMCGVVRRGTGKAAIIEGIDVAGKTGTTKLTKNGVYTSEYIATFVGFLPADDPKLALLVIVERPKGGYYASVTAAPIFKSIASSWIAIAPEFAGLRNSLTIAAKKLTDSVAVPSVCGYGSDEAQQLLHCYGLKANLSGQNQSSSAFTSIVISQNPPAGRLVVKGSELVLTFLEAHDSQQGTSKPGNSKVAKPDLKGYTLRRAISVLSVMGIKPKVIGSGIVKSQLWDKEKGDRLVCTLVCQ